jgi:aquaporin Z
LKLLTSSFGKVVDQTGGLGTDSYGKHITEGGAFLLVFVVLMVTEKAAAAGFAGLAIGLSLTVIHLVGIPLDGTSVNPARALGPALFEGGAPLGQVWLFILAPLVGGALAAVLNIFCGASPSPSSPSLRPRPDGPKAPVPVA